MSDKDKKIDDKDKKAEAAPGTRVRIKIRAYDNKIIDNATKTIIDTAERNAAKVVGPVPLPTQTSKYSVNRSTFVHKESAEQYEIRTHKRLIDIISPSPKAIDALMNLNLPAGVDIEIKMN
jgi:small subunit ribosomal protein S10